VKPRAVSNPLVRFRDVAVSYDEGEGPPPAKVTLLEDGSRSILSRNDSPDLGFRWSANPYRGCLHACAYCLDPATPILLADGRTRPIAELGVGDEIMGTELPPEIVQFIAERVRSNIRRLEGAFIRVSSYFSLTRKPVTTAVVEELLRDILHEENRSSITIELIQKTVADHYDIRVSDLTGKRRPGNIAFPRQVAMYLARQLTDSSLNTIGEAFGGRDHGTVLHAVRQVRDRMSVEPNVRQAVGYIENQLMRVNTRHVAAAPSRHNQPAAAPTTA